MQFPQREGDVLLDLETGRSRRFGDDEHAHLHPSGTRALVLLGASAELLKLPELTVLAERRDFPSVYDPIFTDSSIVMSDLKQVIVFDAASLVPGLELAGARVLVRPDGRQAIVAEPDLLTWKVHALPTGALLRRLPPDPGAATVPERCRFPVWSPDGRLLASWSSWSPPELALVELGSGRRSQLRPPQAPDPQEPGCWLKFTTDGRRLWITNDDSGVRCVATVGVDATLRPAALASGWQTFMTDAPLRAFDLPPAVRGASEASLTVELRADGKQLALLRRGERDDPIAAMTLELHETGSWRRSCSLTWPGPMSGFFEVLTFSPTGNTVAAAFGGARHVVDVGTCRERGVIPTEIPGGEDASYARVAAYRPDGGALAAGTGLLKLASGKRTELLPPVERPLRLIVDPIRPERMLLVTKEEEAQWISPELGTAPMRVSLGGSVQFTQAAFSADGKRLLLAGRSGLRLLGQAPSKEQLLAKGVDVRSVAIADDASTVAWTRAVIAERAAEVHVRAMAARSAPEVVIALRTESASSLRFDPSGRRLAWVAGGFARSQGELTVADVASGDKLWQASTTGGAAFSPDGRLLASGTRLFDAQTGKVVRELRSPEPPRSVERVSFSPDGERVAMAASGTVAVWTVATGEPLFLRQLEQTSGGFAEEGRVLVLAIGARLRVIDAASGEDRLEVGYASELAGRAQTPDGLSERLGRGPLHGELCTLGVRVLTPEVCEAALGGAKGLWRSVLADDPSALVF